MPANEMHPRHAATTCGGLAIKPCLGLLLPLLLAACTAPVPTDEAPGAPAGTDALAPR